MKLRTVGLLGLVAAHLSAAALPSVCLKNYRKTSENLAEELQQLTIQHHGAGIVGVGASAIGAGVCIVKVKTLGGLVICPLIFVFTGTIYYQYAKDLDRQRALAAEHAMIYEVYRDFSDKGPRTELELRVLSKIGLTSAKDREVEATWIKMVESGEMCDFRGRPNQGIDQAFQLVRYKLN